MRYTEQDRCESYRRVAQFLTDHADVVGPANATDARRQLDTVIADIDTAVVVQGVNDREMRGEARRREHLEQLLIRKYMTPLSKFARASLKGAPDYAALTPSAGSFRRARLVQTARSMAAAAAKYSAAMEAGKLPPQFLDQMRASADAVQASMGVRSAKQNVRNGATKRLEVAIRTGRSALTALDSVVSHLILGNEVLERQWQTAKRVRRKLPPAAADQPAAPDVVGTISPATPAAVAPAAGAQEVTKAA